VLGLRPWEFPRYTLREYGQLVDGYETREYRERYRMAELATWLLAPHMGKGKRLRPKDLLGTERKEDL
jgi:hypothetical protein